MATRALNQNTSASTSVAVPRSTSVVSIQEQIAAQVAAMADRIAPPSGSKIKVQPGSFSLPDGRKTPGPIELVIVDFVAKNSFYESNFDANNIQAPVCFAIGTNPSKLVPSANSPQPQAKSCAECPMNQFGSASNGGGKACKNERVLAVLEPEADANTALWSLGVSPSALKGFDAYIGGITRTFNTVPAGVISTVSLDPSKTYASLVFSDPMPNPDRDEHFARQAEAQAMLATEPDLSGMAKPTKKPGMRAPMRR